MKVFFALVAFGLIAISATTYGQQPAARTCSEQAAFDVQRCSSMRNAGNCRHRNEEKLRACLANGTFHPGGGGTPITNLRRE